MAKFRVSTYFRLALIRLSKAICYDDGLISLESDEKEERGPGRGGSRIELGKANYHVFMRIFFFVHYYTILVQYY